MAYGSKERRVTKWPIIIGCAIVALMTSSCGTVGSDSDSGLETVNVGLSSSMSPSWAQFAVAEKQGYFEEEGIDLELQFPGASGDVLQSMSVERTDIGVPSPEAAFAALDKGQEVTMTYNWCRTSTISLAVETTSSVQDYGDLDGKTIGVADLSSGSKLVADLGLRLEDLDPESDVDYVAVGTGAAAWDALRRERVDALALWDTEYAGMENSGANLRLIRSAEMNDLIGTTFVANDSWLESNPELMEGFGRAWAKATVWSLKNPRAAVRAVWDEYPETQTSESAEGLLDEHVRILTTRMKVATSGAPAKNGTWGTYPADGMRHWTEFAADAGLTEGELDAETVYTNEFADAYNEFNAEKVRKSAAGSD